MDFKRLVEQTLWANAEFAGPVYSQEDEDLQGLLSHILLAERVWFQRIRGEMTATEVFGLLGRKDWDALYEENKAFYRTLLEGDLGRTVSYRRFTGEEQTSTVEEILLHLVTHGYHHRGQISRGLSQAGLEAPRGDFITYGKLFPDPS